MARTRGSACWVFVALLAGCDVEAQGLAPGELARIGDHVVEPQELAGVQSLLGAYGQLRFGGAEGRYLLLEGLVATEVLAQAALERGRGDDPRVGYAVLEEIAEVYLSAELERRVPRRTIAANTDALRAHYDAHPESFVEPERRTLEGVTFRSYEDAEAAMAQLKAEEAQLEDFGEVFISSPTSRDPVERPWAEPMFEPGLAEGDWLRIPMVTSALLMVGRLHGIEPAHRRSFDDPAVREELVESVRAPMLDDTRATILSELAETFPERP